MKSLKFAALGPATDSFADLSDEDLLARIGAGDRVAFAALFGRYAPKVKSYLMRLGAGWAAAEDLAQEAIVSVWRRAASYDATRAKASTWIFVIARNAWIDRLRRERVELAYRSVNPPLEESQEEAPDAAAARMDDESRIAEVRASSRAVSISATTKAAFVQRSRIL